MAPARQHGQHFPEFGEGAWPRLRLGAGHSWPWRGVVCSRAVVSSTLETRRRCGASSWVREARGQHRCARSDGAMRALKALVQRITPNVPACLLGSWFQCARVNTRRNMLRCLFPASASFPSSFPKSIIRWLLCVSPGKNSISAF